MKVKDLIAHLSQFPIDATVAIYDGDSGCYVPAESVGELDPEQKKQLGLWPQDRVVFIGD